MFCPFLRLSKSNVLGFQKRAVLLGSLTLLPTTRVPFPIKSLALSAHVAPRTIHFRVLGKSRFGPWKGSSFLQQMATLVGTLLSWDWHPDHQGYSEASLPANGPDPAAATGTPFVPGLLLTQTAGQSAPTGKEQDTLLTSSPFPLSFLSLALPILPVFLVPWSWMQEFEKPLKFLFISTFLIN